MLIASKSCSIIAAKLTLKDLNRVLKRLYEGLLEGQRAAAGQFAYFFDNPVA